MNEEFGILRDEEVLAVSRTNSLSFSGTPDESAQWMRLAGHEHVRVLREGSVPVASLLRIPMGQWFGGRSVPMTGVAAVGVAPERRGHGTASRLMSAALRQMHDEGVPLSTLYAATQPLYRRSGYEQAGHRYEIRLPIRTINIRERALPVREATGGDFEAVRACYSDFARAFNGPLDRGEYVWGRVFRKWETEYSGFVACDDSGRVEGYVYLHLTRKPDRGRQEITLSDIAFSTPRAGRRLLTLLSDFGSMGDDIVFFGGPMHPALFLLSEQRFRLDLRDHWMLRIVSLARALEGRGYPDMPATTLTFEIMDSVIAGNQGRWTMRLESGRATVERSSDQNTDALALDIGALASLYSGYLSASQLHLLGRAELTGQSGSAGDSPDRDNRASLLGRFDAAFAGTTPWMSDMF